MQRLSRHHVRNARRAATRALRGLLRWVVGFHGTPRDIACGAAVGMFVAFTPTIGAQMILAAFLATLLRASRAAAIVPVWITNPLTIPPIFAFTYLVGSWFLPGPARGDIQQRMAEVLRYVDRYDFWAFTERLRLLFDLTRDILAAMWIGGCLVGLLMAVPTYFITLWVVNHARALVPHRHHHTA